MREKGKGWVLKLESPVVPLNEPRNGRDCGDSGSGALFWAALFDVLPGRSCVAVESEVECNLELGDTG